VKAVAWFVLAMVVTFVGLTFVDRCAEGATDDCPPACHLACFDGCAAATVGSASPVLTQLEPIRARRAELASTPLQFDFPPAFQPPRA
jgi:hypothetical protein